MGKGYVYSFSSSCKVGYGSALPKQALYYIRLALLFHFSLFTHEASASVRHRTPSTPISRVTPRRTRNWVSLRRERKGSYF